VVSRQYLTRKVPDQVDAVVRQWETAAPDVESGHLGVVARIHRLAHRMHARADAILAGDGLTQGEFDVLSALRRSAAVDGLTPTALAAAMLVSSGGMTKRLTSLERGGWIARRRSARDGRSVRVVLTDSGRERLDALLPGYFAAEAEVLEVLDDEERGQLAELLRRLSVHQDLLH
jgi:DNA-binding MarR family transcriptional regulator